MIGIFMFIIEKKIEREEDWRRSLVYGSKKIHPSGVNGG
jgi:hypothetical protein